MKPYLVVFLHSDRYDRLYQASSMLLTASSMGWPCHLFLFYEALASYIDGTWDEVNISRSEPGKPKSAAGARTKTPRSDFESTTVDQIQSGFELSNFPSLYDMLSKARAEAGGLKICACSTSCKVLNVDLKRVREKVDEIIGLPTMLQIAENARHVIYI